MIIEVVPITVLSDRSLAPLESIALFLKERGLTNHQIAESLNRNDRTIWTVLDRAKKKRKKKPKPLLSVTEEEVPLTLFHDRAVSPLEAVSFYLTRKGFSYHKIAELLQRDDRTIWTSVHRYKMKKGDAHG